MGGLRRRRVKWAEGRYRLDRGLIAVATRREVLGVSVLRASQSGVFEGHYEVLGKGFMSVGRGGGKIARPSRPLLRPGRLWAT